MADEYMENDNVYAPHLAQDGDIVAVVGKGSKGHGPVCFSGIGFKSNGEWIVQWYEPSIEYGFQPLSFYIEGMGMGKPYVVGFTPIMPGFGMKIKEAVSVETSTTME